MRQTLLELVQNILSSMGSDEVDSITDTVESYQVARLLKQVYYDIAVDLGLPAQANLFELTYLTGSADTNKPVLMTIPSNVCNIEWIRYNNKLSTEDNSRYLDVTFLPWTDFLDRQNGLVFDDTNVDQMSFTSNSETFEVMYRTDRFPQFYTSIGDDTLIFDAFDSDEESTLQTTNTMVYGMVYPTFTLTDNFAPDLDPDEFSYFLNRAKFRAFNEIKQVANQEAGSEARRQKVILQKRKRKVPNVPEFDRAPKYGRRAVNPNIPKSQKQDW